MRFSFPKPLKSITFLACRYCMAESRAKQITSMGWRGCVSLQKPSAVGEPRILDRKFTSGWTVPLHLFCHACFYCKEDEPQSSLWPHHPVLRKTKGKYLPKQWTTLKENGKMWCGPSFVTYTSELYLLGFLIFNPCFIVWVSHLLNALSSHNSAAQNLNVNVCLCVCVCACVCVCIQYMRVCVPRCVCVLVRVCVWESGATGALKWHEELFGS